MLASALSQIERSLLGLGDAPRAKNLARIHQGLSHPALRVVVFGEFSRGKSTLINALLQRLVLPAKLVPTTGHVTTVLYGAMEEVRIRDSRGRKHRCPLERLDEFVLLNRDGHAREDVEHIKVSVSCDLLRSGLMIIDTPGVGDRDAQTRRAMVAISLADIVLVVLDARQVLSNEEQRLAGDWLSGELKIPVAAVVNFMNLVEEAEREAVRQRVDRWCRKNLTGVLGHGWFEVNALGALKHALGLNSSMEQDEVASLRETLIRCLEQRQHLTLRARSNQVRAEIKSLRNSNADLLRRLEVNANSLARERAIRQRELQSSRSRIDKLGNADRERIMALAQRVLSEALDLLISVWRSEKKAPTFEANAANMLAERFQMEVRKIERVAFESLLTTASDRTNRPEPFTLLEHLKLDLRLEFGDLTPIPPSDDVVNGGMITGGVLGQLLIPVPWVGAAVGAALGGFLAHALGSTEPDRISLLIESATLKWQEWSNLALDRLNAQFGARIIEMRRATEALCFPENTEPQSAATELARRRSLDFELARCEQILHLRRDTSTRR